MITGIGCGICPAAPVALAAGSMMEAAETTWRLLIKGGFFTPAGDPAPWIEAEDWMATPLFNDLGEMGGYEMPRAVGLLLRPLPPLLGTWWAW